MLENLKVMLGIAGDDAGQDARLNLILSTTQARLKVLLGGADPPPEMEHIVLEAAVSRYNRIGSEGLSGHTVEGESQQWADGDFDAFADEIQAFLGAQAGGSRGKVRFL